MKIRQRLALRFTLVSALITGSILIFIFMLTRGFVHADFEERLTQQSRVEVLHYATPEVRDVLTEGSFFLVNPAISIFSEGGELLYKKGSYPISNSWIVFLQKKEVFNAERGEYTTVGRRYNISGKRYLVFVSDKDLPGQHELDLLVKSMVLGWIVSLVFSYLAGLYFSGNALQPMKRVVTEVNQITKDNLGHRLQPEKTGAQQDELDELISTFNALLTRIESAFVNQKRFVQHASHELKTPLTAIMAEAELALARDRSTAEYKRTLEVVTQETERLVTITQGLLTLARLEEGTVQIQLEQLSMKHVIDKTLETFRLHHPQRTLQISNPIPQAMVVGDRELLQIAMLNMLDNAVKYSSDVITLDAKLEAGNYSIAIIDRGIGIPPGEISRIRSPLFRASNAREVQGAGLGLSLVDRIIRAHRGSLNVESEEGKGTKCEIILPVY